MGQGEGRGKKRKERPRADPMPEGSRKHPELFEKVAKRLNEDDPVGVANIHQTAYDKASFTSLLASSDPSSVSDLNPPPNKRARYVLIVVLPISPEL